MQTRREWGEGLGARTPPPLDPQKWVLCPPPQMTIRAKIMEYSDHCAPSRPPLLDSTLKTYLSFI